MTLLKLTKMTAAMTMISAMMACGTAEEDKAIDCADGKSIEANSQTYCVFKSAITEEGFNCPADANIGRRYGDLVICANNDGDIPQEMIDKLPAEFPNETLPTGDCKSVLCDLDKTCNGGMCATPQTEEQCIAACEDGCPAPEFQLCASDGQRYCNSCVIGCKGLTQVDDNQCTKPQTKEECLEACGVGCPAPEFQICGEDGNKYCNECVMSCEDVAKAADQSSCDQ